MCSGEFHPFKEVFEEFGLHTTISKIKSPLSLSHTQLSLLFAFLLS